MVRCWERCERVPARFAFFFSCVSFSLRVYRAREFCISGIFLRACGGFFYLFKKISFLIFFGLGKGVITAQRSRRLSSPGIELTEILVYLFVFHVSLVIGTGIFFFLST